MKYLKKASDFIFEKREITRLEVIAIHALILHALWPTGFKLFGVIG